MVITIDGIDIKITKKHIKNIYLRVSAKDATVHLSAPFCISEQKIKLFIQSKMDWIKKQMDKHESDTILPQREYISGEKVYVFGKIYELIVEENCVKNSVIMQNDMVILQSQNHSNVEQKAKILDKWYCQILQEIVVEIFQKWAQYGLVCKNWQVRKMKTRWGSYSTKTDKIWINLQLAQYPYQCIDYLVLHELVHTKVSNHGKDFVANMDKYMPNWRLVKKQLNSQRTLYKS